MFCQYYAKDHRFYGNGVRSYMEAYEIDASNESAYKSARQSSSRLLTSDNIMNRIHEVREQAKLTDEFVDNKLAFWIYQEANPQASIAAIKEYNSLQQRITKKLELSNDPNAPINGPVDPTLASKWTEFLKSSTNDE